MNRRELTEAYFQWMCRLVCTGQERSYRTLLRYLHSREFVYSLPMDGNRADDGMDLRYRFGAECDIPNPVIAHELDNKPCSILEMMVALSVRCEEHIMEDPDIGDRTGQWFWSMIRNLGLDAMTDSRFSASKADDILDRFLERRYKRNGEGGLFYIPYCEQDLRGVEIWYQMCWYLSSMANV